MTFEGEPKFEKPVEKQKSNSEEGFKKEGKLWIPKEERGHIRSAEEIEAAREMILEEKKVGSKEREKKEAEEWYETFYKLGGTRGKERIREAERELAKEKKAMESAKIPEKGIETEQILKEVGIKKPAESFREVEERLKKELKEARVRGGEKLSEAEEIERTRDFYLKELGYSLEYKGLLRGKARLLDAEGKYVVDEKGEPREFKAFFKLKKERTPLIDFLKQELKSKLEKKAEKAPIKETEEERLKEGFQETVEGVKKDQKRREEKISSLQDVKKVGKERLSKLVEGLSYIAALDKLGILGMKKSKNIAIEGGKDLAVLSLTPLAAVEKAGRYIAGRIQIGKVLEKSATMRETIRLLEQLPVDKRPEFYNDLCESMKEKSAKGSEELIRGYKLVYERGKILRLIEKLKAKLSKPIIRTYGPPSPRPERKRI